MNERHSRGFKKKTATKHRLFPTFEDGEH